MMFIVKIKFIDGSEMLIHDVEVYGYDVEAGFYYVKKNGYKSFFNSDQVKYIGRQFDLENMERGDKR